MQLYVVRADGNMVGNSVEFHTYSNKQSQLNLTDLMISMYDYLMNEC